MPQFSLKDLLVATTLFAVWLGLWYYILDTANFVRVTFIDRTPFNPRSIFKWLIAFSVVTLLPLWPVRKEIFRIPISEKSPIVNIVPVVIFFSSLVVNLIILRIAAEFHR